MSLIPTSSTSLISSNNNNNNNNNSTHTLALQVLKSINKSVESAVQLDNIPLELCYGQHIDLHRWTMILNDKILKYISEQPNEYYFIDSKEEKLENMFKTFWLKIKSNEKLITLDISNSKDITDYGITCIARNNSNLKSINISGCNKICDVSLREIALNCKNLLNLNITNCNNIDGTGLIAIAECCPYLIKFLCKNCKLLQRFSLSKLFYNCKKIEEIDISEIKEIGDNEIRILAENCNNLIIFIAKECPFISDQSLLVISQHCIDIDVIDVSRTNMTFRITDVGLLALGSRSFSLRVLKLCGCEQITDVGLTWLSEGCKLLEKLDLSLCNKITDAGLRSIGNNCHNLSYLNINHAKYVSDVGIASIASGCPQLKHLYLHALYLLADPKLGAPKKGEKPEAWQSVVGSAALAKYSPLIESLDISGCFRYNIAIKLHISTFEKLKNINMMGCNQVTEESMIILCKNCILLEEINFSDCGKGITTNVLITLSNKCKNIKILILNRLDSIKSGSIKAISLCDNLERLELSGCKNITDNMLLPICEVDKVTKLTILSLSNNFQLTDTTMAWVAYGRNELLTFSIKGTNITKQALHSVRDRFPFSEILNNDSFFGFWPKSRVEDRKLMNNYNKITIGFTKIQARIRSIKAKKRVKKIREHQHYTHAILLIQKVIKRFNCKMIAYKLRMERQRLNNAALLITSIFWMSKAIAIVRRKRIYLYQIMINKMALKIQKKYRYYNKIMKEWRKKLEYEKFLCKQHYGATKMQSIIRMAFAKNRVKLIKQMREARHNVQQRKAFIIQRVFRGYLGRIIVKNKRIDYHKTVTLKILSTIKIQYKYRSYRTYSIINEMIRLKKIKLHSIIKIQSIIRGALARLLVTEIKLEIHEQLLDWAARKIQTRWFIKKAHLEVKRLQEERLREQIKKRKAAIKIQCIARTRQAIHILYQLREEHIMTLKLQIETEIWAIIKIQSFYRGCKGRHRFEILLREKKGKWKELYDETKKKRFFYNQLTGEIRWRMPQDLLDLIPRPLCDNCQYYEAQVECALCNEVFCTPCWDQVHRGGRRREHEFRSIYDYYGKRIDYGDGIFPCKWPTEIMQDEVQGWMLRVAPIRDPVAIYEDWEEYVDENNDQILKPVIGEGIDKYKPIPIDVSGGIERDGKYKPLPSSRHWKLNNTINNNNNNNIPLLTTGNHTIIPSIDNNTINLNNTIKSSTDINIRTFYFNRATFETRYDPPEIVLAIHRQQEELKKYEELQQQQLNNNYNYNYNINNNTSLFTPNYDYTVPSSAYGYTAPGSAIGYTAPGSSYDYNNIPNINYDYTAPGSAYGYTAPSTAFSQGFGDLNNNNNNNNNNNWDEYNPTPYNYQPPTSASYINNRNDYNNNINNYSTEKIHNSNTQYYQNSDPYNSGYSEKSGNSSGYNADYSNGNNINNNYYSSETDIYNNNNNNNNNLNLNIKTNSSFTLAKTKPNFTSPMNKGKSEIYQTKRKAAGSLLNIDVSNNNGIISRNTKSPNRKSPTSIPNTGTNNSPTTKIFNKSTKK